MGSSKNLQALQDYEKKFGKVEVKYTAEGQIDMSAYKVADANIGKFSRNAGGSKGDIDAAWKTLGDKYSEKEIAQLRKDYTWHHTGEDGKLELVPTAINNAFPHTGGAAFSRAGVWGKASAFGMGVLTTVSSIAEAATSKDASPKTIFEGMVRDSVKEVGVAEAAFGALHSGVRKVMNSLERDAYSEEDYEKYHSR